MPKPSSSKTSASTPSDSQTQSERLIAKARDDVPGFDSAAAQIARNETFLEKHGSFGADMAREQAKAEAAFAEKQSQSERFIAKAREMGLDEREETFDAALTKVAEHRPVDGRKAKGRP